MNLPAGNPVRKEHQEARLNVGFVLAPRFTLCAFANFVDVLRLAADEGDRSRQIHCKWSIISATMDPITSSCGVTVHPHERLGDPSRFEYIVVVGGLIDEIPKLDLAYRNFLNQAAKGNVPLVGVCTGAFILYKLDLMNGFRCCVNWFHHADFLEQFDGLEPVSDQIFVVDRNRLTCSGGVSSAHLAAFLVDRHIGPSQAQKSLHIMIIDDIERGETPQPGIPMDLHTDDRLVKRALLSMQQHISDPLTIDRIASLVGVSRRVLERHFMATIKITPSAAYMMIRLEHAEFLLAGTDRTVSRIAADSGFCDTSHFARALRKRNGQTPVAFRDRKRSRRNALASLRER